MDGFSQQAFGLHIRFGFGLVRMDPDRTPDIIIGFGHSSHAGELRELGPDGQHRADTGRTGTRDHRIAVSRENGKIEVAMAVDQHGYCAAFSPGST